VFVAALKSCGWLEEGGKIHDWEDYAGRILVERAKDRERKRAERARIAQPRPPEVRGTSEGQPKDVTPEKTGVRAYPTQPNPTLAAIHTQRARESWPVLEDVRIECSMRNIPADVGEVFWNHFEAAGWVDKHGNPIHRWRPRLTKWWTDQQEKQAKDAASERRPVGERREIKEKIELKIL
jgi:hypothetical protein